MTDINLILLNDSLHEVILHKIKNIIKICVIKSFTDAIKYVSHSGRIDMTLQDWIYCLKYNAVSFCKNIDSIEDFDNQYHNLLELYNVHNVNILDNNNINLEKDNNCDTSIDTGTNNRNDNKQIKMINRQESSLCQCDKCVDMYDMNNKWDTIKSQNIIIETIKVNIDNIILQKFKKYIQ